MRWSRDRRPRGSFRARVADRQLSRKWEALKERNFDDYYIITRRDPHCLERHKLRDVPFTTARIVKPSLYTDGQGIEHAELIV